MVMGAKKPAAKSASTSAKKPVKCYVVDTNGFISDPTGILQKLRNGNENKILVPSHVDLELDKLKNDQSTEVRAKARLAIKSLKEFARANKDNVTMLRLKKRPDFIDLLTEDFKKLHDLYILEEILQNKDEPGIFPSEPILVTNDEHMQFWADEKGIKNEPYLESTPFKSPAERNTGVYSYDDSDHMALNSFYWNERNKPVFWGMVDGKTGHKELGFQMDIWNQTPRTVYQNMALWLLANPDIHIVSLQSEAGYGKSYLSLAAALYLTLEKKSYEKIFVCKPMVEVGEPMGFLPGRVEEKMEPYFRYINDLLRKLHNDRPANRIFINTDDFQLDQKKLEILPFQYIRGMNLENCVVIVDEMQNVTRAKARALLSRMGENVKCFCLGDINQVDTPHLNQQDNGLNWIVSKFINDPIYAHLVLKGKHSRGPITDLVLRSGL